MLNAVESGFGNPDGFENIVQLASEICQTKSALINFLDDEYQWTLFNVGWEKKKIPKKDSICQLTTQSNELLYIPDTDKESRIKQIEAVKSDPKVRFYAGVGFTGGDGAWNGTLCVIDNKPKKLSHVQKKALKTLAAEVETRLNLIRSKQKVEKQNRELKKKAQFLKNSTDVMFILNQETLTIEEVHAEDNGKLEYTSEELKGTKFTEYCTSKNFTGELQDWLKERDAEKFTFDTRFIRKSGNPICLHLNASIADDHIYITGRDVSIRKASEVLLKKEKALSDGIIENLPGVFCLVREDGTIRRFNKNMEAITGYKAKEIENANIEKLLAYDSLENTYKKLGEVFKDLSARAEITVVSKSGEKVPFLVSGFRHEVSGENYAVIIGMNISEEKKTLYRLEEKDRRLEKVIERLKNAQHIARLGSWEWQLIDNDVSWSDETYKIFQVDKEKQSASIDLMLDRLSAEGRDKMLENMQSIKEGRPMLDFEHDIVLPDGGRIHVYERGEVTFDGEGNPVKVTGTIQDITEQKKTETKLKKALEEKEVMLIEIHHRVKNNLAIVSGLLQLESGFTEEDQSYNSLVKSITRIKSMAAIHEQLYESDSFSDIYFGNYINKLVSVIKNLYQDQKHKVDIEISSDDIELNINQAIPCALILNELITNAFKHAFPNKQKGLIEISLVKKEKEIRVCVKDNGVGIEEDKKPENSSSLGFTLLEVLCKQLNAEYKISNKKGAMIEIQFNKEQLKRGSSGNAFNS